MEMLLVLFLIPYLIYVSEPPELVMVRETEVYAQDVSQMLMYEYSPEDIPVAGFSVWVDDTWFFPCDYRFRYCTRRYYDGGDHKICAAECLQ